VEVYRSSYTVGNRFSLGGRAASFKVRPACIGKNDFATRADARAVLAGLGFAKVPA
jgi:hypothetical protein